MRYILDTDHLTLLLQGQSAIAQRLSALQVNDIAITVVTVEEQLWGRLSAIRQAAQKQDVAKLVRTYRKLRETLDDLSSLQILDFTESAYNQFQGLRQQKIRIGSQDLRIASIALSVNAIVVTRNQQDFSKVPNLQIEDWTS